MQRNMTKRWQRVLLCALIAAGSSAAAMLLSHVRFFQVLNARRMMRISSCVISGLQATSF